MTFASPQVEADWMSQAQSLFHINFFNFFKIECMSHTKDKKNLQSGRDKVAGCPCSFALINPSDDILCSYLQ